MMYDGGWMWGQGWGAWLVMCVAMLLFWAGLITATVLGIRYLSGSGHRPSREGTPRGPEDLLAERYARGEIDDDEYRRRLTLLREHRVAS